MLSMQYPDGEPGLAVPVMELPSLLVDAFQIDLDYHRYPEWVLGALWRKFAANTGFAAAPFGWRGNPDFTACTCWLYVELTMPTIGKSPDDLDFMHDHIVHLFLVRGNRVLAAVKIEPWRGQEADIYKIAERRRATTRAVP